MTRRRCNGPATAVEAPLRLLTCPQRLGPPPQRERDQKKRGWRGPEARDGPSSPLQTARPRRPQRIPEGDWGAGPTRSGGDVTNHWCPRLANGSGRDARVAAGRRREERAEPQLENDEAP